MQFNKFSFLRSALATVLGLTLAASAMAQPKYLLRWGHYLPDGPFLQLEKDFAAKIEKRTNGAVKIEITFAGGLGKDTELLMLAARGAIDMTATAPGYNPDQLRYWRAFQTPMLFTSTKQVSTCWKPWSLKCPFTSKRWTASVWFGCFNSPWASTT